MFVCVFLPQSESGWTRWVRYPWRDSAASEEHKQTRTVISFSVRQAKEQFWQNHQQIRFLNSSEANIWPRPGQSHISTHVSTHASTHASTFRWVWFCSLPSWCSRSAGFLRTPSSSSSPSPPPFCFSASVSSAPTSPRRSLRPAPLLSSSSSLVSPSLARPRLHSVSWSPCRRRRRRGRMIRVTVVQKIINQHLQQRRQTFSGLSFLTFFFLTNKVSGSFQTFEDVTSDSATGFIN